MKIRIENRSQLLNELLKYNEPKYIFRGQTSNYSTNEYDHSFLTSFERIRCNPAYQFKWSYYSRIFLETIQKHNLIPEMNSNMKQKYVQALLQHYGWRSNFIDLSYNPYVSLFFAGYSYKDKSVFHMTEDCYEKGVLEHKKEATYIESKHEFGYLYIIDREKVMEINPTSLVDLAIGLIDEKLRPVRQRGLLLENCEGSLNDIMCVSMVSVLEIPSNMIHSVCGAEGITTNLLFPNNGEDAIYQFLLSLPRKVFENNEEDFFDIYLKPIQIPEYNIQYEKFQVPSIAYYKPFWIKEILGKLEGARIEEFKSRVLSSIDYRCNDDISFHVEMPEDFVPEYSEMLKVLEKQPRVLIEYNNLFSYGIEENSEYQKGFFVELLGDMIAIEEIGVEYSGTEFNGIVGYLPRYYKVNDDNHLISHRIEGDCPCNDEARHSHLLFVAKILLEGIAVGHFKAEKVHDKSINVL